MIASLVERLVATGRLHGEHAPRIIDEICRREHLASTAFGHGLAFPDLRTPMVSGFMGAVGFQPSGIAFDSNDGKPTKLVFLTLSPCADRSDHDELLSRLVSLLSNKAKTIRLTTSDSIDDLHQTLCQIGQ